jgi:hypothetical protein
LQPPAPLELRTLPEMFVSSRKDDSGTLIFGSNSGDPTSPFGGSRWRRNRNTPPQFEAIPNVAGVMARIREAQAALLHPLLV